MNTRVGFLILAHKYTEGLRRMVEWIAGNDVGCVVLHVDAKSDIRPFQDIAGCVCMTDRRIDVRWGEFSQIEAMLQLLAKSRELGCTMMQFLSGDSLPVKDAMYVKDFYDRHGDSDFMSIAPLPDSEQHRLKYLHHYPVRGRKWYDRLLKPIKFANPYFKNFPPPFWGSTWFCINARFRDYVFEYIEKYPFYLDLFRRSRCGDELFFHTLLADSPHMQHNLNRMLMYVDFQPEASSPQTICSDDIDSLDVSDMLFARKVADDIDLRRWDRRFRVGLL